MLDSEEITSVYQGWCHDESKFDPRYLKPFVRAVGRKDGVSTARAIPHFECGDADYAEFLPVDLDSGPLLTKLRTDPKRGLICIDWKQANLLLQGNEKTNNYEILELMVLPCNHRLTHLGDTEDRIPAECIADLAQ